MANEAYRAVFLRVHPTGKMVLSLTTEADGHEGEYAQLVAKELGVPLSTSSSIVCSMFALSSSPSEVIPPLPSRTRSDRASARSVTVVSSPR